MQQKDMVFVNWFRKSKISAALLTWAYQVAGKIIVAGIDATTGKWLDKSKMNCWITKRHNSVQVYQP
jgi:hypothetical protein